MVAPTSQSVHDNAEWNKNGVCIPKKSFTYEAGTIRRQAKIQQPQSIDADADPNWNIQVGSPAKLFSTRFQTETTNLYTSLVSNRSPFRQTTPDNNSVPRGSQGQDLHTKVSSHSNRREDREVVGTQTLPFNSFFPRDSPADVEPRYKAHSVLASVARLSPSSSEKDQVTLQMTKKGKSGHVKNHKKGAAEKNYLEKRDGQLYHKIDEETEWRESTRSPSSII